jgi:hypothetical protein
LIHCANAESVLEKTLAKRLADAFSKHLPAWQTKRNPTFSPRDSRAKRSRAIRAANERWGFSNPVQARLRRDLKAQRQLGSPKHSPAPALSVSIRAISGFKILCNMISATHEQGEQGKQSQ